MDSVCFLTYSGLKENPSITEEIQMLVLTRKAKEEIVINARHDRFDRWEQGPDRDPGAA